MTSTNSSAIVNKFSVDHGVCYSCFQPSRFGFCLECDVAYLKCNNCQTEFSNLVDLSKHLNIHPWQGSNSEIVSCSYALKSDLLDSGNKPKLIFICQLCSDLFAFSSRLLKHRTRTHDGVQINHECKICRKKFHLLKNLQRHESTHQLTPTHCCEFCSKSFHSSNQLKKHQGIHQPSLYICDICSKSFSQKYSLERHFKQHSDRKLFKCAKCDKKFHFQFTLKRHVRTHEDNVPEFECHYCQKKFTRKNDLQRHIMNHLKILLFRCTLCDEKFCRKSYLDQHILSHGELKKYICFCGKLFKYQSGYSRHKKTHQS